MLKSIRLTNFKSFVDEQVSLAPLTFLVGANASGKSNLLDAIRFLQGAALGMTFDEVLSKGTRGGITTWPGIRGGTREIAYEGSTSFSIDSTWYPRDLQQTDASSSTTSNTGSSASPREMRHQLSCQVNGGAKLLSECVSGVGDIQPLIEARGGGSAGVTIVERDGRNGWRAGHGSELGRSDRVLWLRDEVRNVLFQELRPSEMRGWGDVNAPLGTEGQNFAGRLAAHFAQNPEARVTLVDWLKQLCAPEIDDIDFIRSEELGEVMLVLIEKGGKRISARSISDGTLRFLGLFVSLFLNPYSVVVLEEVDTGLHPTRLRALVEMLEQVPRERPVQIIATTHSPTILQWLGPESLRDVVVFGRVPERPGTIMRRLQDLDHFEAVLQHERIDELFSTGWMEMAL